MNFIKFLIFYYKHYDTPFHFLIEEYRIHVKHARRCAYDLRHAADCIPKDHWNEEMAPVMQNRARMWIDLFTDGGTKDYRVQLHNDIDRLEFRLKQVEEYCLEHGLNICEVDPGYMPF